MTKIKKILLISNNGMGFYNFKKELVIELLSMNYDVYFAVPYYEKLSELVNCGAKYYELIIDRRGMNPIKDMGLFRQLRKIIKEVKPNVMILHTIKPNIYASILAKFYNMPYLNNITGLGSTLQIESIMAKIIKALYRISLSHSNGIFFENIGNMDYFEKNQIGNKSKFILVPGAGVNTDHFNISLDSDKTNTLVFLYIARIMKEKGIEEYLDAAEYLKTKSKNKDVKFQILGYYDEDSYRKRIDLLSQESIIEYLGESTDTRAEMSQADCIVLPSYHEGMSNVLLEGAAMGLPIITTDINGCKETVEDGFSGFLCEAKNVGSLINAMEKFIALSPAERKEMGKHGRKKMELEFDRRLVVNRYIKCIQTAIKE